MNELQINELNITEGQKEFIPGWVEETRRQVWSIRKDKEGLVYVSLLKTDGELSVHRFTKAGYWDGDFESEKVDLTKFEVLYKKE